MRAMTKTNISMHNIFMRRCLELAANGLGSVAPNPMVGCVIVHNEKIIGEGYHRVYGGPHAEVHAINSVIDASLLPESTLYVNLEPCAHFGKTPPCASLIVSHRIPRVVIANTDTNPLVAGKGIEKLRLAGCEVITGVLEHEARLLNKRFFTFHEKKRPWVILKWAQTLDGFIDRVRSDNAPIEPTWINAAHSRILVHKWRTEEAAILTGTKTALLDNPSLTARDWQGKNPVRILLDKNLAVPSSFKVLNNEAPTIVFNALKCGSEGNVKYIKTDFNNNLPEYILQVLHREKIQSLIVEGGALTHALFIASGLWDEARVFTGPVNFGAGVKAAQIGRLPTETLYYSTDRLDIYYNTNNI